MKFCGISSTLENVMLKRLLYLPVGAHLDC